MSKVDFKKLRVGRTPVKYSSDKKIKALPSKVGCGGCTFQNEFGAKHCQMSQFCIGHLRPDKTPVIFVVFDSQGTQCLIK